jgi:hypothetical protein
MTDLSHVSSPGRFWRGNLHTHSTLSDGVLAPEQVVARYVAAGYDFFDDLRSFSQRLQLADCRHAPTAHQPLHDDPRRRDPRARNERW